MDSFLQPTISAASNNGENAMVALSKREKLLSTYVRNQQWSLPDSIIYYISKNPSNSKVYEKMIQSCKYFFIKNPLLVVSDLYVKYEKNQWNISLYGKDVDFYPLINENNVILNRLSSKLWITDKLRIDDNFCQIPLNIFSTVLLKIHQSDIKKLQLSCQKFSITDLEFLASKCEEITLHETTVINEDDSIVGLEKIIEVIPKIKGFINTFSQNLGAASANVMTSETVQKLIKVPHFSNLVQFSLNEVPEIFDIDTIYDYIKKNKRTKFHLNFGSQLSQEYRNRLQTIIYEIIGTQNHEYKVPFIIFRGIDLSSLTTLLKLYLQS